MLQIQKDSREQNSIEPTYARRQGYVSCWHLWSGPHCGQGLQLNDTRQSRFRRECRSMFQKYNHQREFQDWTTIESSDEQMLSRW